MLLLLFACFFVCLFAGVRSEHPGHYKDGTAAIYGMAESIPDRSLVDEMGRIFVDAMYTV